jgi:predicted outer membrane repeat protein
MLSGNQANTQGGGIYSNNSLIEIADSTISNNSAGDDGGGIIGRFNTKLYMDNSTVSSNSAGSASGNHGGGVAILNSSLAELTNNTLFGNTAGGSGGGLYVSSSAVDLDNNLIVNNAATVSGSELFWSGLGGGITADSNNLFGDANVNDATAFSGFMPGNDDLNATSDGLSIGLASIIDTSLSANGCLTPVGDSTSSTCPTTHKLVPDSPAISAADSSNCPARDQRGKLREEGFFTVIKAANSKVAVLDLGEENCDIGATEFLPGD